MNESTSYYYDATQEGDGGRTRLWSCLICGTLVRGLFKEAHQAWHRGECGPPERAILLDLIVDLRDMHADGDVCMSLDAADRAEARLRALGLAERSLRAESSFSREVTGDE